MLVHILLALGAFGAVCILFDVLSTDGVERFEAFQLRLAQRRGLEPVRRSLDRSS